MSAGFIQAALPIAGAVAGSFIPGLGTAAGMALGSAVGGAAGGMLNKQDAYNPGALPAGVTPEQGPLMPNQTRNQQTGQIAEMTLPKAPGGDTGKAPELMRTLTMLGEMEKSKLARGLTEAQIAQALYRAPIMPSGVSPGAMGSYGPATGMKYW